MAVGTVDIAVTYVVGFKVASDNEDAEAIRKALEEPATKAVVMQALQGALRYNAGHPMGWLDDDNAMFLVDFTYADPIRVAVPKVEA